MAMTKGSFGTNLERYQEMRSILTEYGHYGATGERPVNPKPRTSGKVTKKHSKRPNTTSAKKSKNPFLDDGFILEDAKEIIERKKEKDKRVLDMLNDVQRSRYYYYLEYKDRLVDKVEKQREELQKKRELEEKKRQKKEEQQAEMAHKLKKRLERVPLKHDSSFLKDIPKSDFYHIVQEEHKLRRSGVLKSHSDFEEFWNTSLYQDPFEIDKSSEEANDENAEGEVRDRTTSLINPLGRIEEEGFHMAPKKYDNRTGKQYQKHLETLFPKMELPRLHIFDMDLSEKVNEEEERRLRALEARMQRRVERKQIQNRMFTLALTHQAATKRILEDRLDPTSQLILQSEFTNLGDLVARRPPRAPKEEVLYRPLALEHAQDEVSDKASVVTPEEKVEEQLAFSAEGLRPVDSRPESAKLQPIPLTMKELESALPSMTAQCLSTMWRPSAALHPISMPDPLLSPLPPSRKDSESSAKKEDREDIPPSS